MLAALTLIYAEHFDNLRQRGLGLVSPSYETQNMPDNVPAMQRATRDQQRQGYGNTWVKCDN
jgi:hypothetical protein